MDRIRRQGKFFNSLLGYKSLLVGNRREAHKAMHDAAYPVGHEFWDVYYPPNGWGCRCDAVSMDDDDVQRYGITKIEPDVDAEFAASVPQEWRHNVGQAAFSPDFSRFGYLRSYTLPNGETALRAVKAAYRNDIQKIVLTEDELAEVLRSVVRSGHRTHSVSYPVGVLGGETSAALARVDILVDPALMATDRQLLHAIRDSKRERGQAVPPLEYGTISRAINRPDSIWEDPSPTHGHRELHFVTESDDGRLIKAVFHVTERGTPALLFRNAALLPEDFDYEFEGFRRVK